ncbi:MAG: hypothetical protein IKR49_05300 [Clostridia bacterium]|nr:hypothetical protein [Clostridia bacterium]
MRKICTVLVALAMCICLCSPAFAADTDSLASLLDGVDVNSLSDSELSSILDGLNLEGVDLDSIRESFSGGSVDTGALSGITDSISSGSVDTDALSGIADSISSGDTSALSGITDTLGGLTDGATGTASTDSLFAGLTDTLGSLTGGDGTEDQITDTVVSTLSGMFGGMDMSWLSGVISDPESILSMFTGEGGISTDSFDFSSIMDMISGAFSGGGFDISALTSGIDLGNFDITSVLGGLMGGSGSGDIAGGISDGVAGISDQLKAALEGMGLDPSIADTLLDNDIVNFFANLFIGLKDVISGEGDIGSMIGGLMGGDDSGSGSGGGSSSPATPNTGDDMAAFAALGVLCAASCAAFVCLKKKRA